MARNGETITYSKAKNLVENYKQTQQDTATQSLPEFNFDETNATEIIEDELISVLEQTERSPTVEISQVGDQEIQVAISYINVNLNITGQEDRVIAFLTQSMSDPNVTSEIIRQIESQIDKQVE